MATSTSSTPPPPPLANFPPIERGGSLMLAWQIRNKRVLIVGGGEVASGRLIKVLESDALVTLIAPSSSLHPEVRFRIFHDPWASSRITYHDRHFHIPSTSLSSVNNDGEGLSESMMTTQSELSEDHGIDDLEGIDMVLTAIDDVTTSQFIYSLANERRIPTNVADIPPECDFYFGSQIRSGPLQIMISTNGKGPKIANIVRRRIEEFVEGMAPAEGGVGKVIERVGALRERLRSRAPGTGGEVGKRRMKWMIGVCEDWSLEELGLMDDDMMERLLDQGWEKNGKIPSFLAVGGARNVAKDAKGILRTWATPDHVLHLLTGVVVGATASLALLRWSR